MLTLSDGIRSVTVMGDAPADAINAPLTKETVERNLTKLGGTVYAVRSFDIDLTDGLMLPISRLNDLRRRAVAAWEEQTQSGETHTFLPDQRKRSAREKVPYRSARFRHPEQISPLAKSYFDRIFVPLGKETADCNGAILPPVLFDSTLTTVRRMLAKAAESGIRDALVGNLGHVALAKEANLMTVGDFRLNATNSETVLQLEALGLESVILSPELTLPQVRDVAGNTALIVYGRIPLMTLEKCVIKEIADCRLCATYTVRLRDRKGITFPVLREWEHRNVIYNSLPTAMSDKQKALTEADVRSPHFLFSVESRKEVEEIIRAYQSGRPLPQGGRRI